MKKLLLGLALISTSAMATEHLACSFGSWNPTYKLNIKSNSIDGFSGKLDKVIQGFGGSHVTPLSDDSIKFRLNPSSCELKVLFAENTESEITTRLDLNSLYTAKGGEEEESVTGIEGSVSGIYFGSNKLSCEVKDKTLITFLQTACQKHQSIDTELEFTNILGGFSLSVVETNKISELQGIKEVKDIIYPKYEARVYGVIEE